MEDIGNALAVLLALCIAFKFGRLRIPW